MLLAQVDAAVLVSRPRRVRRLSLGVLAFAACGFIGGGVVAALLPESGGTATSTPPTAFAPPITTLPNSAADRPHVFQNDSAVADLVTPILQVGAVTAFERRATSADTLPRGISDYAVDFVVAGTSRLVGTSDGVSYYLVEGVDIPLCVLIWPNDDNHTDWMIACGGLYTAVEGVDGAAAQVVRPTDEVPSGWSRIDSNLIIRDR
ncbi:MAG: hypothetical protein JWQ43_1282 [Glaciihabitans sp.]|nr:hypothetical protein [Glaciihabitans sp.]